MRCVRMYAMERMKHYRCQPGLALTCSRVVLESNQRNPRLVASSDSGVTVAR